MSNNQLFSTVCRFNFRAIHLNYTSKLKLHLRKRKILLKSIKRMQIEEQKTQLYRETLPYSKRCCEEDRPFLEAKDTDKLSHITSLSFLIFLGLLEMDTSLNCSMISDYFTSVRANIPLTALSQYNNKLILYDSKYVCSYRWSHITESSLFIKKLIKK